MGFRGKRDKALNPQYSEPDLMRDVDGLLTLARENGCYDGDKLNVNKLINYINTINPNETISLCYAQMEHAISGSLTYENGSWLIRVNKNHNYKRQRFTILHELGHYILHRNKLQSFTDEVFFRSMINGDNLEYNANQFASILLMPETNVRSAITEGIRNVGELAERFDVSSSAMSLRVQDLGYKLR